MIAAFVLVPRRNCSRFQPRHQRCMQEGLSCEIAGQSVRGKERCGGSKHGLREISGEEEASRADLASERVPSSSQRSEGAASELGRMPCPRWHSMSRKQPRARATPGWPREEESSPLPFGPKMYRCEGRHEVHKPSAPVPPRLRDLRARRDALCPSRAIWMLCTRIPHCGVILGSSLVDRHQSSRGQCCV